MVVEPLPADVRGLRGRHQELTPAELYALAPVVRTDTTGATQHFRNLRARLAHLALDPTAVDAVSAAVALADHVATDTQQVPVQARWHGDLTPWNCARQPDGQLWAWDWESSEPDVVAGLDAVHWHFSVRREAGDLDTVTLASCLDRAARHLTAAGWGAPQRGLVAAVYALSVVERAASLAAREGTWDRLWIRPGRLVELLAEGRSLLAGG